MEDRINSVSQELQSIIMLKLNCENNQLRDQILALIKRQLKTEQSSFIKELAKKSKQLFVLSSDKEQLIQKTIDLQSKIKKAKNDLALKDKQILKTISDNSKYLEKLNSEFEDKEATYKNQIKNLNSNVQQIQLKNKADLANFRRQQKQQIARIMQRQQEIALEAEQKLKQEFAKQKLSILQNNNQERSALIKKYQTKIQKIKDDNEQLAAKTQAEWNQKYNKTARVKNQLQNQTISLQGQKRRLQGQLKTQITGYSRYKQSSESLKQQLDELNLNFNTNVQQLGNQVNQLRIKLNALQKSKKQELAKMQESFRKIIEEKDQSSQELLNTTKLQHKIQIDTLTNNMMEQKQISNNEIQMKHYQEMFKERKKLQKLQAQYNNLKKQYASQKDVHQNKMQNTTKKYEIQVASIQERNQYQLSFQEQLAKKQIQTLKKKYQLQIKALKRQQQIMIEEFNRKIIEEKVATTNKLTAHYQAVLSDTKANYQIAIKQKMIQFQRKSKGYQKRLAQAQKRRLDLKILLDRNKLQAQMKIDSLVQISQKQELQIQDLNETILDNNKQKQKIINDYQFKLLVKKNQLQQTHDDYQIKQQELRNILNDKIVLKNKQINKLTQKMKIQAEQLIKKNSKRVSMLEKQYDQLKKVVSHKTSLPQDVQALKLFHKGYLQIEEELKKEKKKRQEIQRQLNSKDQIDKVFSNKGFTRKVKQERSKSKNDRTTLNKFATSQDWFKANDNSLVKFKSQNL